jgi:hypothetical protein
MDYIKGRLTMAEPKLVVTDLSGYHNDHIDESFKRLQQGGSWKKQRIIVILPTADMISAQVMLSLWNLAFPPNNGVVKMLALGDEVGVAYSHAIESILAHDKLSEWEYICTIEHDNLPTGDGVIRLVEQMEEHPELSCISGLYYTKGPQGVAQIWGDVRDPLPNSRPQPPDPNGGLVECCGTGMGFALWRLEMFKDPKLRRPWFKTLNGKDGQGMATQDLYFWGDARKHGYRCAVDCSVKVGHIDVAGDFGPKNFVW